MPIRSQPNMHWLCMQPAALIGCATGCMTSMWPWRTMRWVGGCSTGCMTSMWPWRTTRWASGRAYIVCMEGWGLPNQTWSKAHWAGVDTKFVKKTGDFCCCCWSLFLGWTLGRGRNRQKKRKKASGVWQIMKCDIKYTSLEVFWVWYHNIWLV